MTTVLGAVLGGRDEADLAVHTDRLGSVTGATDGAGQPVLSRQCSAFGGRTRSAGRVDAQIRFAVAGGHAHPTARSWVSAGRFGVMPKAGVRLHDGSAVGIVALPIAASGDDADASTIRLLEMLASPDPRRLTRSGRQAPEPIAPR